MDDITKYVNRFVDSFVRTSDCTASWTECGDADNNKINANFKKGGSVVYQSVELLMNNTAEKKMQHIKAEENLFLFVAFVLMKCIASNPPFLKLRLSLMRCGVNPLLGKLMFASLHGTFREV